MSEFCIACESGLPKGKGIGEVCLGCFRKLKAKPIVKAGPRGSVVVVFPLPCAHSENCPCWKRPPKWGVMHVNARGQSVYVGGPFKRREAEREARKVRMQAKVRRRPSRHGHGRGEAGSKV